jgi:hypothetical protein
MFFMIFPFPLEEKSVPIPAIAHHSQASGPFIPPFMLSVGLTLIFLI